MAEREPHNPFYLVLLLVSLLFVITALAWAVVPELEKRAAAAGSPPPPSQVRDLLRRHGGKVLLAELAAMVVIGLASMVLDRLRALKKERESRTIPPSSGNPSPPSAAAR